MIDLTFKFDRSQLEPFRNKRLERAILRAVSKAGGDGIRAMRTDGSRMVRELKRIKAGKVRKALPVFFPKSKRDLDSLVWRMDVSGRPIAAIEYSARQVKAGVSVHVNKAGKRKTIPSAFIAVMKSGHRGVFRRKTKGGPRLPIEEIFSTTVANVFENEGFVPALQKEAQKVFASSFARLLPLELNKLTAAQSFIR